MKLVYSDISGIFDTEDDAVNTIIIENQKLFKNFCEDIYNQIQGMDGKTVVSIDNTPADISKNVELLTQFVPFEINKKGLLNKLSSFAEQIANEPDHYENTMSELARLETYLWGITDQLDGNIVFAKLTLGNIIKAVGLEFEDDYYSLGEKIIDYMELVRTYDKDRLFIFVNLRSFITDDECFDFFDTILRKHFHVIMLENYEYVLLANEKRLIVDKDCCEII